MIITKEEFFQQACLQAITRVEPAYWDDSGVKRIIEFADAVTNKVFSKEESIDEEKLDDMANKYLQAKVLYRVDESEQFFINLIGAAYKAGYRKAKEG